HRRDRGRQAQAQLREAAEQRGAHDQLSPPQAVSEHPRRQGEPGGGDREGGVEQPDLDPAAPELVDPERDQQSASLEAREHHRCRHVDRPGPSGAHDFHLNGPHPTLPRGGEGNPADEVACAQRRESRVVTGPSSSDLERAAALVRRARRGLAFTGAGVSAESGIPTFRGPDGLWKHTDPVRTATLQYFLRDPTVYWTVSRERWPTYQQAQPNPGHRALAALEAAGHLCAV